VLKSIGWYLNLVSPSKVKCLVYCDMWECTNNFIQWKNRERTMTFGFGFCSVLYKVRFSSVRVLAHFLLSGSVWFLAKPGFWCSSFFQGSGSFPSLVTLTSLWYFVCCVSHAFQLWRKTLSKHWTMHNRHIHWQKIQSMTQRKHSEEGDIVNKCCRSICIDEGIRIPRRHLL